MTVCKKCGGSGWDDEHMIKCLHCHGSGEVQITNEEYIHSLNTEQLAEWIVEILFFDNRLKKHIHDMGYINMHGYKTEMVAWLKQPHT